MEKEEILSYIIGSKEKKNEAWGRYGKTRVDIQ